MCEQLFLFRLLQHSLAAASLFRRPPAASWYSAVAHAAQFAPQARIVVLDVATGHLLAASHLSEAARTLAAPGSTLKPLALYSLVDFGPLEPIAPHRLHAKTHRRRPLAELLPSSRRTHGCAPGPDLVLQHLLRHRCRNAVPRRTPQSARPDRPAGPDWATGRANPEATAVFRDPKTPDQNRLTLLGVDGVQVTPLEFAVAYRWLANQISAHSDSAAAQVVQAGLQDSASFGMAGAASLGGVPIAGKTGTASPDPEPRPTAGSSASRPLQSRASWLPFISPPGTDPMRHAWPPKSSRTRH